MLKVHPDTYIGKYYSMLQTIKKHDGKNIKLHRANIYEHIIEHNIITIYFCFYLYW